MSFRTPILAACCFVFAVACGDDDTTPGGPGGGASSASGGTGGTGGATATCEGAMVVLQKDAYRDVAGRSSELWPPHTTTELSWTCTNNEERSSFQANHGTEPGDVDANGDVFLVDVGQVALTGTAADLTALHDAYDACQCDTAFLSLDALEDQAVQELVGALADYITANLTCTGSVDAAALVTLLQMGDIDAVIAAIPNCTWTAGTDWSGGFDEALGAIITAANEVLDDYHVCNNDALLQAKLIDTYKQTGSVVACNGNDALCHGPTWFYTP